MKDAEEKINSRRDVGTFFVPTTGAIQKAQSARVERMAKPSGGGSAAGAVSGGGAAAGSAGGKSNNE
jgi:hypothetical protein